VCEAILFRGGLPFIQAGHLFAGGEHELGPDRGNWKQVKGKFKEERGKLTDGDLEVIEGKGFRS
jgi:hypothetical protein